MRKRLANTTSSFIQNGHKILHKKILHSAQDTAHCRGGLIEIYKNEVLPQQTRTVRLVGVKCSAKIIQTLLGYEVQACHKRIQCPDHVTARYLKLFSELGCHTIRLPYDPTLTARLIPQMEESLQRIKDTVSQIFPQDAKLRQYVIRKIYIIIREELTHAA